MSRKKQTKLTDDAIQQLEDRICLNGSVDFDTVPALWDKLLPLVSAQSNITLDLSQVEQVDSAALVMLLQLREMVAQNPANNLSLQHIPQDLIDLACLSNVAALLTD